MFTARCVPNMYLFGTFSAQNRRKSRHCSTPREPGLDRPGEHSWLHALGRAAVGRWGNVATWPPTTPLRGGRTPRNGTPRGTTLEHFAQD